jgi:hypothetical protein
MRFVAWAFEGTQVFADDLTEKEFQDAKSLADRLGDYTEAQETFRAVLENYGELEVALLTIAQEATMFGHIGHSRAMHHRILLDRRFANLLSSCRLYLHYARSSFLFVRDPQGQGRVKAAMSREYECRVGYRVMEALRNYVQHRGFPLSGLTYFDSPLGPVEDMISETYVKPTLAIDRIRADKGVKSEVMTELEKEDGDLRRWTRDYVEGLRQIHLKLIPEIDADIEGTVAAYLAICRRFAGRVVSEDVIVRYERRDVDNRALDRVAFTRDIVEHTNSLRLEHRHRYDITRHSVSNAIRNLD